MKKLLKMKNNVSLYVMAQLMLMKSASASLPWEDPLDTVVESITGPVATGISVLACVVVGLALQFMDIGSVARRGLMLLFGIALALMGSLFIAALGG